VNDSNFGINYRAQTGLPDPEAYISFYAFIADRYDVGRHQRGGGSGRGIWVRRTEKYMQVYYDKDCDLDIIRSRKVAVIGYGSQGHAHACNLQDSGVDVRVGLRAGSGSWAKAEAHGLKVLEVPEAVREADLVMILTPDEFHRKLYTESVEPNIRQNATLAVAHGFSILYGEIEPRADLDVIMIAPKAPGHTVRNEFVQGRGIPDLIAVA